jgi:hypothetical protein
MKNVLLVLAVCFLGFSVQADDDHTDDVCTTTTPLVCAHLGHMSGFNTKDTAAFVAHATVQGNLELENFSVVIWSKKADQWLQSPSAPTLTKMRLNKYHVSNVRFEAADATAVHISYKLQDKENTLVIPVTIQQ